MRKKGLFVIPLFLALAWIFSNSTTSNAQTPEPTATPEWVKPIDRGAEPLPILMQGATSETPPLQPEEQLIPPILGLNWYAMVFQSYRDGNYEIYSATGTGQNQTNLTNRPDASDARSQLNREATRIVFNSDRDGDAEIYVMNYDGTGLMALTANKSRSDYAGAWSPDSSRIAFVSNRDGDKKNSPGEIYVMNADGSAQTRLTYSGLGANSPCWSPDGSQIAWVQYQDTGNYLMLMNADGSNQHILVGPLTYLGSPAWSPDGQRIAFDYDADGDNWNELAVINVDGSGLTTIYDPGGTYVDAWMGSWSFNQDWLFYSLVRYVVYHNQLYISAMTVNGYSLTSGNSTLVSTAFDVNPDCQTLDRLIPESQVDALPEYSPAAGFEVSWSGSDQGPSGVGGYEVQYRLGLDGVWDGFVPEEEHGTSYPFSSDSYDTAYFRSRAYDNSLNWEAWPDGNGNTWTKLYSWLFGGQVKDMRGHLLVNADISISPSPWETDTTTDRAGEFQVHLKAEGDYTLNASHTGYGAALPASTYITKQKTLDRDRRCYPGRIHACDRGGRFGRCPRNLQLRYTVLYQPDCWQILYRTLSIGHLGLTYPVGGNV